MELTARGRDFYHFCMEDVLEKTWDEYAEQNLSGDEVDFFNHVGDAYEAALDRISSDHWATRTVPLDASEEQITVYKRNLIERVQEETQYYAGDYGRVNKAIMDYVSSRMQDLFLENDPSQDPEYVHLIRH